LAVDFAALETWTRQQLNQDGTEFELSLVAGDASPRQYFRASWRSNSSQTPSTAIAVLAPPTEKTAEFLLVQKHLEQHGIRVPRVLAQSVDAGFMLLEDLGDQLLLPLLTPQSVARYYGAAQSLLVSLAHHDLASITIDQYDEASLRRELDLFPEWYIGKLLNLPIDAKLSTALSELWKILVDNATEQPQVFVHRDFHSRNIMALDNDVLAVIDFQDAVIGPITYDLVSLLKDCYVHWPRQQQLQWSEQHRAQLMLAGVCEYVSKQQWQRWFDLMGLQRHLKVLGIFARLSLRDGKSAYLNDLPLVMNYVIEILRLYASTHSAFKCLLDWFETTALERCADQAWYTSSKSPSPGTHQP